MKRYHTRILTDGSSKTDIEEQAGALPCLMISMLLAAENNEIEVVVIDDPLIEYNILLDDENLLPNKPTIIRLEKIKAMCETRYWSYISAFDAGRLATGPRILIRAKRSDNLIVKIPIVPSTIGVMAAINLLESYRICQCTNDEKCAKHKEHE